MKHAPDNASLHGAEVVKTSPLIPNYVIASSNEIHFNMDRENLRMIGLVMSCRLTSSGAVLDYIRHNSTSMIILDSHVSGGRVPELIHQIRKHLGATPMSILVISEPATEDFVIDAITAGCTGFIIRPYTLETLKKHIRFTPETETILVDEEQLQAGQKHLAAGDFDKAIDEFTEIVADSAKSGQMDEARKYFNLGNQYLLERKYGKAIIAFNNALRLNHLLIRAYEGLAHAYKGKGDMKNYHLYMQKAAEEYARMDNFAETKRVFAEITKHDIHAPNAYNTLGIELRHKKMYSEAINAYKNGLKLSPKDENIYYNLAKAQMFASLFADALHSVRTCLSLNRNHSEAAALYAKLTDNDWDEDKNASLKQSFVVQDFGE